MSNIDTARAIQESVSESRHYSRLSAAEALLYREAKARRSMEQDYVFSSMDSGSEWLNCMERCRLDWEGRLLPGDLSRHYCC